MLYYREFNRILYENILKAIMIRIDEIVLAIREDKIYVTKHAVEEMRNDELSLDSVLAGTCSGEIIKQYPDDKPLPSCLIFGRTDKEVFHSVWAYDKIKKGSVLITVYVPDPEIWDSELMNKKG